LNRDRLVKSFRFLKMEKICHHPAGAVCDILLTARFISDIVVNGSFFTMCKIIVSRSVILG
jgi:hypothetical protein